MPGADTVNTHYRKFLYITCLIFIGCTVNHEGLLPTVEGERHLISCGFEYSYRLNTSYGMLQGSKSTEVCSNGRPDRSSINNVCTSLGFLLQEDRAGLFDEITSVTTTRVDDPVRLPESCSLSSSVLPGEIGENTNGLQSSAARPRPEDILHDSRGAMIGNVSDAVLAGTVASSSIWVGAKFLRWRYANTSATGSISFDGGTCGAGIECELMLRHLQLQIQDFKIVRPTAFARDINFSDVKLYSINNYRTTRLGNGSFNLSGIELMVSGIQNGQSLQFQTTADVTVSGQFGQYLPGGSSAPQRITIRLRDKNENFYINGEVIFETSKAQARLKNHGTSRCLRSSFSTAREVSATIESCRARTQPQSIALETRNESHRIRNTAMNTCLNLKSSRQNFDGGTVAWVNCSNHVDQLWSINNDGHIVHQGSGRCLNVHRGRENRDGGQVSVYRCANTPDQRWSVVTPR
ncbi:MAG: RICIN domain-containing protein [Granulosicoccus sp.]|nr:RICIN domain-containing protein [Granulosicoccus sp.]